ncbi:MAG TPA: AAA-like domain-containing protein [Pyrinomonadaceae bacterium]|nr:AAA-like domain-containing protein [Pyrinomonadaceae bacterium]
MSHSSSQPELQVGGAVQQDKVYIVRRTDDELFRALRKGEYCNVVCPRQMGKTSVIHRIQIRLRNEGCRTALLDIRGRLSKAPNANDWYLGLLHEFSHRFQLGCDVKKWWKKRSEPTANQKLLAFFQEQMIARRSERFIVFLDEIDSTIELPYTDDFFVAIRSLYNDRAADPELERLTFCLVGVFTPNELVKDHRTTAYNIGRSFELEDFDPLRDDLKPLARILSSDLTRGNELLGAVLAWTGGQPYLTVSACQKVVDAGIASPKEVDQLIEDVFITFVKPSEHSDETHFDYISSFLGQRVSARIETAELYQRIMQGHTERETPTPAVAALKLSGLVKADRNGRLVVRNEIYRRRFSADWATNVLSFSEPARNPVTTGRDTGSLNTDPFVQRKAPVSEQFHQAPSPVREPSRRSAGKLFISHSLQDEALVHDLRAALTDHGQEMWIDSRELRGGDVLWTEVERAIDDASVYAVVVSPDALQSKWVGKELRYALELREQRGKDLFPILLLSLNDTKLGVLEGFFREEPIYIPLVRDVGGIEAGVNAILVALGKRLPADVHVNVQPRAELLEELVLELTDLKFHEQDGVRRASARARLIYEPATSGVRELISLQSWQFIAPIGPIEAEELRWYLEKYAIWPSLYFRDRARRVEASLVQWGQLLHKAAMPMAHTANVMNAWGNISEPAGRRFSIYVDSEPEPGASDADAKTAKEAAALMLALPWELLHDGNGYLFQGAKPVRVRRRLPNRRVFDVPVVSTPARILLVTARPEDDACGYIDHRTSALPLVEAMESLPGLVKIHVLSPPTLPALRFELERARTEKKPYHVVHFDGHGIFSREVGLGGLCFEKPEDVGKLENRGHVTVFTSELGPVLHHHRIPLVFLEACQTAQAEKASESVASELLKVGVASVVAMSHSVLVETARRFVEAFYETLADGKRVGDAMLAGQRALKDDTFRGRIFGAGELRLQDWFVPVLYQEKDDPQLFKITPGQQTQEDFQMALARRLGDLPPVPETGFIGRSRELLALQRLLREERFAVVRGQGGEGKTALAAEFARWMVRSQQIHRAAFVSVETHSTERLVVDALGNQLVNANFSAAGDLEEAINQVERVLREQPTVLVIDNMESVLLPPFMAQETPEALSEEAREDLKAILALCERLLKAGDTRVVFTSREALPPPFDFDRNRRELHRLDREDAIKLVERVLNVAGDVGTSSDAAREEIEQLVDAVHCHARTLVLLAPSLRKHGVEATRESLVELMFEMEKNFPGSREKSLFASVELSLRRMSAANLDRARVLGVFHGAVDLDVIRVMMEWEEAEVTSLAGELIDIGLATPDRYGHLTLTPALCPYLRSRMDPEERDDLTARWIAAMQAYVKFLERLLSQNAEIVATLTVLELPNLFAVLDLVQRHGDAEATIDLATSLYALLQSLGKPRLLERVSQVRDYAAATLGDTWSHAQFSAARTRIEQQLAGGSLREALTSARQLWERARTMGEQAYANADLDIAMAGFTLARVLQDAGGAEQALLLLDEAQQRFETIAVARPDSQAEQMVDWCFAERGNCLLQLGRLEEAVAAYQETISRAEKLGDERMIAVTKSQLGTVRLQQRSYKEALDLLLEARKRFTKLDEPGTVARVWHQTGLVYQQTGQLEAAEDAYRQSLAIEVRLGNVAAQAATLGQLGNLYTNAGRLEEAVALFHQAADMYSEQRDVVGEGRTRINLAAAFRNLGRLDEARHELQRAIESKAQFSHASSLWNAWAVLASIEEEAGNSAAAADANRKAIESYLAYRRDGGENHDAEGRLSLAVTESLLAGDEASAQSLLQQLAETPNLPGNVHTFIRALQAIIAGSRDRTLADAPDLHYGMAAEILLLIETLEKPPKVKASGTARRDSEKVSSS